MLTDFRNFSIVEFLKKLATNWLSHCPPNLKRVVEVIEVNVVSVGGEAEAASSDDSNRRVHRPGALRVWQLLDRLTY